MNQGTENGSHLNEFNDAKLLNSHTIYSRNFTEIQQFLLFIQLFFIHYNYLNSRPSAAFVR